MGGGASGGALLLVGAEEVDLADGLLRDVLEDRGLCKAEKERRNERKRERENERNNKGANTININ